MLSTEISIAKAAKRLFQFVALQICHQILFFQRETTMQHHKEFVWVFLSFCVEYSVQMLKNSVLMFFFEERENKKEILKQWNWDTCWVTFTIDMNST